MTQRERELECVIADLTAQVRAAEQERDALRAELDELEKQEPVFFIREDALQFDEAYVSKTRPFADWKPLYAKRDALRVKVAEMENTNE